MHFFQMCTFLVVSLRFVHYKRMAALNLGLLFYNTDIHIYVCKVIVTKHGKGHKRLHLRTLDGTEYVEVRVEQAVTESVYNDVCCEHRMLNCLNNAWGHLISLWSH